VIVERPFRQTKPIRLSKEVSACCAHPVTRAAGPLQQHDRSFHEASYFGMPVAILIITESCDLAK